MSRGNGIWVSPTEFVQFASPRNQLSEHIATRDRSPDFSALGMYLPNPDPILKRMGRDISAYRDLRSDAHVGGCVRRRKAAVKSLEWSVEQGDAPARLAKKLEAMFKKLDMNRIMGEMVEAALYGYQPMEIMWGTVDGWLAPVDIVGKPQEWFVFGTESELRFRSRDAMLIGEALPERKFLIPRQDPSYLNPYGLADLSLCFWPATFKRGGLKFWVTFTEKYGTPWLVGKTPRNTPEDERDTLLGQLGSMVQDAVAVIPDDSSVDIVEGQKTSSSEIYQALLMYCRSEISIALLGQNQTTEANSNKASATAGLEVTKDIRDADVSIIESAFNELMRWIVELNTGSDVAPTFSMWEQQEVNEVQAKRDETLTRAGVVFTPAYWMRTYDLRDDDLEVVAPMMPSTPSMQQSAAFSETGHATGCACCGGVAFAEEAVNQHSRQPAALIASKLEQQAQPAMADWLAQIEAMLEAASSLDEFRAMLLTAFDQLPSDKMGVVMSDALIAAGAAGRFDVAQTGQNISGNNQP